MKVKTLVNCYISLVEVKEFSADSENKLLELLHKSNNEKANIIYEFQSKKLQNKCIEKYASKSNKLS